jgi:hypothetical protein
MAFVAVLTIMMLAFLVVTVWSALRVPASDDKAGPAKDCGRAGEIAGPETLEGVLVRQVTDGAISGVQYRRAMQRLAERDADRHPLTVPPEN